MSEQTTQHEGRIVTAADWEARGFRDGQHGNVKFPPRVGHSCAGNESRDAYLRGYERGQRDGFGPALGEVYTSDEFARSGAQ